jgi:NTE family protein
MEFDMVFEGGGAKGMVFVGAMQVFEERGHTYRRLLGTSAGAITAALLAAGYTAQEMLEAMGEKDQGKSVFSSFMAQPGPFERALVSKSATLQFLQRINLPFIPDFMENKLYEMLVHWIAGEPKLVSTYSFLEYGGMYSADHFLSWMKKRLDTGTNNGKPRRYSDKTLQGFFDETGYELTLIASDTTGGAMLVLNHHTAPNLPLVWAVRMSMSIPLLWQEVIWQPGWGEYRGRPMVGHAIVDGGMLSNFPIELFVSQEPFVRRLMGPEVGESVLGMLIDESLDVPGIVAVAAPPEDIKTIIGRAPVIQRVSNLLNTALSAHDKLVSENFEHLVVRLPARGFGTTEFEMTDDRRGLLVQAGCDTMTRYLDELELAAGPVSFGLDGETTIVELDEESTRKADKLALRMLDH